MKYIDKLRFEIVVAVLIGFLFAGTFTHATYPCAGVDVPEGESTANCVLIDKAIMYPGDLVSNKQGSLVQFATKFAGAALVTFGLLALVNLAKNGNRTGGI